MRNRRKFLKYLGVGAGLTAGAGTWWAATSQRRTARWLRRFAADARRPILPAPEKPAPRSWPDNAIALAWLGHATVVIHFYGARILTDPALGSRVGVSLGIGTAGPKRYVAPALTPKELPPIDLVLLSHAHMDHMDLPTLITCKRGTPVITARKTQEVLAGLPLRPQELGWGERTVLRTAAGELEIEAFEVKHWGARWPSEVERGYNGYILRREGKALIFGGDTARTPLFRELRSRGPFEAAIMPIAAYRPWIWNHCTPEEALEMVNAAGARFIVPVHHQTFRLSEEPLNEPIERLEAALADEPERLALRRIGETWVCPA